MKKIAIVGFGRFGKVLFKLLKDDFFVSVFDSKNSQTPEDLKKIYENEVIFFAVPISSFESVIRLHQKYFKKHLLIDVLSVKMHPRKIFKKYLKGLSTQAMLTHPMFGPDSSYNGFSGLPMIMDRFCSNEKNYNFWKHFFAKKGLQVIEMSAKKHDLLAAKSQGLTHFIGRLLEEFKFESTIIDSVGSKKLQEVMGQICNDSWELFMDLQIYNPYAKKIRLDLGRSFNKLNKLFPK